MSNTEIWKDIQGYENLYQVSNLGNVKSLERYSSCGRILKEKIMKQTIDNGYCYVNLCKDGKKKKYLVHRIVATAFIPNPDNLPFVNHRDENKQNNIVSNLEFCDAKYNLNYGTRNERIGKANSIAQQKTILQLSKSGNIIIKKWDSISQASKELKINCGNIAQCCRGKYKTCGGYRWMYYDDYINRMNNYFDMALKEVS